MTAEELKAYELLLNNRLWDVCQCVVDLQDNPGRLTVKHYSSVGANVLAADILTNHWDLARLLEWAHSPTSRMYSQQILVELLRQMLAWLQSENRFREQMRNLSPLAACAAQADLIEEQKR